MHLHVQITIRMQLHVHIQITIHVNASTHTNHHPLPKAGCEQKLIHKKVGCEVILSANRPNSRYQTPPIQLHTSGVVKRSHGCGTLFSTTSMFVQRSTILIYIHPELLWNYMRYGRCRNMDVVKYNTCSFLGGQQGR
jgi:hypothetical protein